MCCSCMHYLLTWVASFGLCHASYLIEHHALFMCGVFTMLCFFSIVPVSLRSWGFIRLRLVHLRGFIRSSSSWTRSSSLRDFRQDDRYPGSHYYHCYASCFVLSLCCATYHFLFKPPKLPWTSNLCHPSQQTIDWLCYRFCSAPLIALLVAGEIEDFSMVDRIVVGTSQYLLYY